MLAVHNDSSTMPRGLQASRLCTAARRPKRGVSLMPKDLVGRDTGANLTPAVLFPYLPRVPSHQVLGRASAVNRSLSATVKVDVLQRSPSGSQSLCVYDWLSRHNLGSKNMHKQQFVGVETGSQGPRPWF